MVDELLTMIAGAVQPRNPPHRRGPARRIPLKSRGRATLAPSSLPTIELWLTLIAGRRGRRLTKSIHQG
jgi:hypothetical protein